MICKSKDITLREINENDITLLSKWLSDEEILKYYGGRDNPFNVNMIKEKYFDNSRKEQNITQCIIEHKNINIGYLQFYPISNIEREEFDYKNASELIFGMDQFIGEKDYWNKGIGTDVIFLVTNHLFSNLLVNKIVMNPQIINNRAIHIYEKCGFKKKKLIPKYELHEGQYIDCWLMELQKNISTN